MSSSPLSPSNNDKSPDEFSRVINNAVTPHSEKQKSGLLTKHEFLTNQQAEYIGDQDTVESESEHIKKYGQTVRTIVVGPL